MKLKGRLLILVIILASILRLYQLGKTPIALEWDEVALGYDAYSILRTGKDQFGKFLPNNFRSLDDYKPPLYVYMAIPAVAIFGLTEFATRLPSAIFGILAVILTYYLIMEIFSNIPDWQKQTLALISSLFLAISPWHLQFSRAAFETNLSVTVTLLAVLCFLKGINKNTKFFLFSSFFFGLALFSYHSTRVVTPLLLLSLLFIFKKKLPSKKILLIFFLIYSIFVFNFIPIATSKEAQIRFLVTNDLNAAKYQEESSRLILQDEKIGAGFIGKIFHNRRIAILNYENLKKIIYNYSLHFSPEFLFVRGDVPLHHAPSFGVMYFFDMPLLLLGVLYYFRKIHNRKNWILPVWLLLGPIPAAVTWPSPHAVRSEIVLPTLQIFSALGLLYIFVLIKKIVKRWYKPLAILMSLLAFLGTTVYFHQYYFHTNIELSRNWMYGRKEATEYTESVKNDYDKVLISLQVDMPYIFWLFYSQYPPEKYLAQGGTVSGGFADERNHFDKYEFRNFSYNNLSSDQKLLLVGIPKEFPADSKIVKTIYYLDGTEALKIAQNR